MVTRREWYSRVNATWPKDLPALTAGEAERAARRLYRFVLRKTYVGRVHVSSGNRYSAVRYGSMTVNPSRGWKDLVHELSHSLRPDLPHSGDHARLEIRMAKEVLRRGWLSGSLKDEPEAPAAPADKRRKRLEQLLSGVVRWERKLSRAQNALKKLRSKLRRLEREVGQ